MLLPAEELAPKAREFLAYDGNRLNFLEGAVRSGKTILSLIKWAEYVHDFDTTEAFLMTGKTERTLLRNVVYPLQKIVGKRHMSINRGDGVVHLFGKTIFLAGANNELSEGKIRGITIAGAYADEITLYPESFVSMLLSRLSVKGAKLYATMNPDSPYHYVKTNYIDRADELGAKVWHFELDDNNALDPEYVEALKKEYTGLWYQRYILGLWVLAEGVIYQMFDESLHVKPPGMSERLTRYAVSVDYGTHNPCVFGLFWIGIVDNTAYMVKEYYYDSIKSGRQKTDQEYASDLRDFIGGYPVEAVIVDPSALSFITELKKWRKQGMPRVIPAINDVLPGIQQVSWMLNNHRLYIHPRCKNTIREFGAYVWDDKAVLRGEDKPKKESDHCQDMLRYYCSTWWKKGKGPNIDDARGYGGIN